MTGPPNERAIRRLDQARIVWVATVRAGGRPHLVPVWFVWREPALFICIGPNSVKARNLATNPHVCLALEDGVHPVICEGLAREVEKPWPQEVVAGFRTKYDWDIISDAQYTELVEVTPRKWLAW